ncbi:hypothetical protein B0H14DRAFT_2563086 [Mycena olivaceomarginata]|nr:hypothetical protein B0H14DRAFT_2563086 [Mycena olivaceomarginata]
MKTFQRLISVAALVAVSIDARPVSKRVLGGIPGAEQVDPYHGSGTAAAEGILDHLDRLQAQPYFYQFPVSAISGAWAWIIWLHRFRVLRLGFLPSRCAVGDDFNVQRCSLDQSVLSLSNQFEISYSYRYVAFRIETQLFVT